MAMNAASQLHWCGYSRGDGRVQLPWRLAARTAWARCRNAAAESPRSRAAPLSLPGGPTVGEVTTIRAAWSASVGAGARETAQLVDQARCARTSCGRPRPTQDRGDVGPGGQRAEG